MFKVTGTIGGMPATVEYKKGLLRSRVTGDDLAVIDVEARIKAYKKHGTTVGPVGMDLEADIRDPLATLWVILDVFDQDPTVTGDIPEPPDVPTGAII